MYQRFRPDHRVTVKRRANDFAEEDISDDVVSIHTGKVYGHAAGGFQIITTFNKRFQGKRYDELVKPNDILHIELDGGLGTGLRSVMICLVDRVSRVRAFDRTGKPTFRVKISGLDFGKLLMKHNCAVDIAPLIGEIGSERDLRIQRGLLFSGVPFTLVRSVFESLFLNAVSWADPYYVMELNGIDGWATVNYPILESTGPVWSAMKSVANEPFNILSTETRNGRLHVVLSQPPFDAKTGKLTRINHNIEGQDIAFEDLGVGDHDRYNFMFLKCDGVVIFGGTQGAPIQYKRSIRLDSESIPLHGFIPYYPKTNFVPPGYFPGTDADPGILLAVEERAEALWNRVKNNANYESGTIRIKGNPDIRCGDGILLPETNMEYFVEGVHQDYEWGDSFITTLSVTRGQSHGGV